MRFANSKPVRLVTTYLQRGKLLLDPQNLLRRMFRKKRLMSGLNSLNITNPIRSQGPLKRFMVPRNFGHVLGSRSQLV